MPEIIDGVVRNDVYQQAIKKAGDKGVERGRLAC